MATTAQKAWKGKEWFTIVAPKLFSDKIVGETPSFDPNSLVGRTVETSLFELVDGAPKYYMKVKLKVACGCCPMSQMTLKMGIERAIKKDVPQVKEVVAV